MELCANWFVAAKADQKWLHQCKGNDPFPEAASIYLQ
jgi:hypothetical protein